MIKCERYYHMYMYSRTSVSRPRGENDGFGSFNALYPLTYVLSRVCSSVWCEGDWKVSAVYSRPHPLRLHHDRPWRLQRGQRRRGWQLPVAITQQVTRSQQNLGGGGWWWKMLPWRPLPLILRRCVYQGRCCGTAPVCLTGSASWARGWESLRLRLPSLVTWWL